MKKVLFILFILWFSGLNAQKNGNSVTLNHDSKLEYKSSANTNNANSFYKSYNQIKIGNLKSIANKNNGIIPLKIQGIRKTLMARPSKIEYISEENYSWHGDFDNVDGYLKIINKDGLKYGNIKIDNRFFEFQTNKDGQTILFEYDTNLTFETICGYDHSNHEIKNKNFSEIQTNTTFATTSTTREQVQVLVLYTDAAENAVTNITGTANLAIEQMNDALENSDVDAELELSISKIINLDFNEESNWINNDIQKLSNDIQVQNLRNQYGGDIVVLLTDGNYYNAYSYSGIYRSIGPNNNHAYAIVEADLATSSRYEFAHQIGHLFGGRHDDDPNGSYEHGYEVTGFGALNLGKAYTIMTAPIWDTKILYFSNPNVEYKYSTTGTSTNNVALKLKNTASTVSNFRDNFSPLSVFISGPSKGYNAGTYTYNSIVSNGVLPYSYYWEYSYDGINYLGSIGTTPSITIPLPLNNNLILRLTITSSDGQTDIDFHSTINLDAIGIGHPKSLINIDSETISSLEKSFEVKKNNTIIDYVVNNNNEQYLSSIAVYPNPINEYTNIAYRVNVNGNVRIIVTNMYGIIVDELVNMYQLFGSYSIPFNPINYRKGIYFCKIISPNSVETIKLMVN